MPERSYRCWQANAEREQPPNGPRPQPARDAARELVVNHAQAKPAWGQRKIWAMTRHDRHQVSQATVVRLLRDDGLILPSEYQTWIVSRRRSASGGLTVRINASRTPGHLIPRPSREPC